uniref:RCC1 domain-containing protein 1 n=1 Tax=Falco tinnunculus TaxID=100819 RepID=A0A8C4XQX0_FALTI
MAVVQLLLELQPCMPQPASPARQAPAQRAPPGLPHGWAQGHPPASPLGPSRGGSGGWVGGRGSSRQEGAQSGLWAHGGAERCKGWRAVGYERHGQLGHGTLESVKEPRLVEALAGVPMQTVAAGGWHSASVSEAGDLYMWGWNESGQLALPSKGLAEERAQDEDTGAGEGAGTAFISIQAFPALLDLPQDLEVSKVSCGSRHTAVITRGGELYTWGWGKYGQLGHRDNASSDQPRRVEHLVAEGLQAEEVVCGLWTTYVCVLEP